MLVCQSWSLIYWIFHGSLIAGEEMDAGAIAVLRILACKKDFARYVKNDMLKNHYCGEVPKTNTAITILENMGFVIKKILKKMYKCLIIIIVSGFSGFGSLA